MSTESPVKPEPDIYRFELNFAIGRFMTESPQFRLLVYHCLQEDRFGHPYKTAVEYLSTLFFPPTTARETLALVCWICPAPGPADRLLWPEDYPKEMLEKRLTALVEYFQSHLRLDDSGMPAVKYVRAPRS